jgi:hypothetical protein
VFVFEIGHGIRHDALFLLKSQSRPVKPQTQQNAAPPVLLGDAAPS